MATKKSGTGSKTTVKKPSGPKFPMPSKGEIGKDVPPTGGHK